MVRTRRFTQRKTTQDLSNTVGIKGGHTRNTFTRITRNTRDRMSDRIKSSGSGGREAISRVDRGKVLAHRARTCNRAIRMGKPNLKLSSVPNHLHLRQREFELATSQGITELAPGQSFGRDNSSTKAILSALMTIPPVGFVNARGTTPPTIHVFTYISQFLQVNIPKGLPVGRAVRTGAHSLVQSSVDSFVDGTIESIDGRATGRRT
jgi:hypothetical protein